MILAFVRAMPPYAPLSGPFHEPRLSLRLIQFDYFSGGAGQGEAGGLEIFEFFVV